MNYARSFAFIALMASATFAFAQDRGTLADAKALFDKAIAHAKSTGAEKALADFSEKPEWKIKDIYVFVVDTKGIVVAHGGNKGLVGKSLMEFKDPNGKLFVKEMIETGMKGTGTVDYFFTDPQTKKMLPKQSYVARLPGYEGVIGVGAYK